MASVKVAVRVRPLNKRELDMNCSFIINMELNKTFITNVKLPTNVAGGESHTLGRERVKQFTFDHSYCSVNKNDPNFTSQAQIYDDLGCDVVESAYQGYNACVFAYGQTGSGKTYTMMGNPDLNAPFDEEDIGLIPRICQNLFGKMKDDNTTYRTEVSYMEIYNERVRDLLREKQPKEPPNLRVREHPKEGPYVQDLSKHLVVNYEDIEELMGRGNLNRTTAATNMNDHSSRSHAIFCINFTQARFTDDIPSEINSKINLVDLAGSERVDASGATGVRLKEGGSINRSLVTLGNVISTLADLSDKLPGACRKNLFIPYRDSVLTWLLKDSLGGNSRTIMIATISPADCNYAETLSTLRYASRAKRIINKPTVNEDPNVALIRELREENARLKALLGQNIDFDATQEKLTQNEEKVKILTEKWTGKWEEAATILHEHKQLALRREGSGVVLDSDLPYLLALEDHVLSTGMKLYHLKEGDTKVGREDAGHDQDIVVEGQFIEAEHCVFTHYNGEVRIVPLHGALCSVNNVRIHERTKLGHGSMIRLGRNHVFRFNHPGEVAKLREELKMKPHKPHNIVSQKGEDSHFLKVCPDFQWTWSTLSVVDSAVGSTTERFISTASLDLDLKSCSDELEKLEEKRRQIEQLEEEHCLAEAARLAQLAEQEGNKVELEEKQEELQILKEEATSMKLEAEEAHKEIKRLSANIEQQVEEHLSYKEKLAEEQQRLAEEKNRLENDLSRAREERQRLRKQREKEEARIQIEKERQMVEWAQLNQEKRQLQIKKQTELEKLEEEKKKVNHVREVEQQVYSAAMNEMRNFIQAEVQEMKRLSGLESNIIPRSTPPREDLDNLANLDQFSLHDEDLDNTDVESELEFERASIVGSVLSEGRGSIMSLGSIHSDDSRVRRIIEAVTRGHVPGETENDSDIQSEMSTSISMKSPTDEEFPDIPEDGTTTPVPSETPSQAPSQTPSQAPSGNSVIEGPVLPAKYLEGSPKSDLPPQGLGVPGLSDSLYGGDRGSTSSMSHSLSMDEITAMLNHLSLQVYDVHAKVCEVLTRRYTSILSSDDSTAGLGTEVITRFAHIRPLFNELEKIAIHASKQTDRRNLPERLEHYDRTLTTIDQFLRIHEALQAISNAIKKKHFLEAVENLERVNLLFSEVDVDGEAEKAVYKVLQTEICIQREQLLFQLGETFNTLLKWTLPNDSQRNANRPRTTTLEVSEEEGSKDTLAACTQAMSEVNLLSTRLKTFCDRLMTYCIEAVVQDRNTLMQVVAETNRSILCVVQYPKSQAQKQLTPVPVPPGEVFTKLEQIFIFLHGPLSDISIQESPRGGDGAAAGGAIAPLDFANPQKVQLIQKFGQSLCKRLFDYLFNQCLQHAIPRNNKNWDRFNEVVSITERFQETLGNLGFCPPDSAEGDASLMDYFNNVNSMFANMKSQEILRKAHELMTQDLHNSVVISADYPMGRDAGRRAIGGPMPEGLVEFIKTCRDEAGTSQQKIPTCQISVAVRSLVCLAYDTLREAVHTNVDSAAHLRHSVQNIFEFYCDVIPSYHKEKLTNLPLLAALHHNNCMFVAHHLLTLDKQFKKKLTETLTLALKEGRLGDLVPQIRRLGNDNFTQHIVIKKEQICNHLISAEGFDCVADDEGDTALAAIKEMLAHLRHIATVWYDVLPSKVYTKAVGTLLNAAVTEVVDNVTNIGEFSADDCETLQKVLLVIADEAPELFHPSQGGDASPSACPEVTLHESVSVWPRYRELILVLNSGLADVADRWADGKGPLALHFKPEEVRRLVIAMFENTSRRDSVLAQIR